jgi:hypothetical protein
MRNRGGCADRRSPRKRQSRANPNALTFCTASQCLTTDRRVARKAGLAGPSSLPPSTARASPSFRKRIRLPLSLRGAASAPSQLSSPTRLPFAGSGRDLCGLLEAQSARHVSRRSPGKQSPATGSRGVDDLGSMWAPCWVPNVLSVLTSDKPLTLPPAVYPPGRPSVGSRGCTEAYYRVEHLFAYAMADGIGSSVRLLVFGDRPPTFAGQISRRSIAPRWGTSRSSCTARLGGCPAGPPGIRLRSGIGRRRGRECWIPAAGLAAVRRPAAEQAETITPARRAVAAAARWPFAWAPTAKRGRRGSQRGSRRGAGGTRWKFARRYE